MLYLEDKASPDSVVILVLWVLSTWRLPRAWDLSEPRASQRVRLEEWSPLLSPQMLSHISQKFLKASNVLMMPLPIFYHFLLLLYSFAHLNIKFVGVGSITQEIVFKH